MFSLAKKEQKRQIPHQNRAKAEGPPLDDNENSAKQTKTEKRQKTMLLLIYQILTAIHPAECTIKTNPIQTQSNPNTEDPDPDCPSGDLRSDYVQRCKTKPISQRTIMIQLLLKKCLAPKTPTHGK